MTWVCKECGGENVYRDAYVNVNDQTDVRTFDYIYCDDCEGQAVIVKTRNATSEGATE